MTVLVNNLIAFIVDTFWNYVLFWIPLFLVITGGAAVHRWWTRKGTQ